MLSQCARCGGSIFEVVENSPRKSRYKVLFVQCASCGAPTGPMEYFNSGAMLEKLEKKIDGLAAALNTVNRNIAVLEQKIRRLEN